MALTPPPINFDLVRATLAQAVQSACGLDSNSVVMGQPEAPNAKRPELPFCEFQTLTVAQPFGADACLPGSDQDHMAYVGPRAMTVSFQFYGTTHEEAFGMACCWQSALGQDPTLDLLRAAGIVVWRREAAMDLSELLSVGWEGRSGVTAQFGLRSWADVYVGSIVTAPISATIQTGQTAIVENFAAQLSKG